MADYADTYRGNNLDAFLKGLDAAKAKILSSRPTAVSLWNGVQATVKGAHSAADVGEAVFLIKSNAARFIDASEKAVELIGKIGSKRICDGDTIMTHCNSSAALAAIIEAHNQGKEIKVFATETRPWRQGLITVRQLYDAGVDTTLIVDTAVRSVMKQTDKVFVGADTVTSHGALINKVGTSQLALAAHESRAQFYCCTETYKFSPMTLYGDMVTIEERDHGEVVKPGEIPDKVKIYNPVFDSTPGVYIDAIITELGMISPGSVYGIMMDQLGEDAFREGVPK